MEIEVQEDFLSFDADLVAEQLTYMDAVREAEGGWVGVWVSNVFEQYRINIHYKGTVQYYHISMKYDL